MRPGACAGPRIFLLDSAGVLTLDNNIPLSQLTEGQVFMCRSTTVQMPRGLNPCPAEPRYASLQTV